MFVYAGCKLNKCKTFDLCFPLVTNCKMDPWDFNEH